jgi:hypothetical protein
VVLLRRSFAVLRLASVIVIAAALAGCSNRAQVFGAEGGWFSRPLDIFEKPDWSVSSSSNVPDLSKRPPVGPEEFVNADGSCAAPVADASITAQAAATDSAVGTTAGDLGTVRTASTAPAAAPVPDRLQPAGVGAGPSFGAAPATGGVALGMTECDVVRRAGQPQQVAIGADAAGERTTVVTYLSGNAPGIYHFSSGRLKVIDQAPQPAKPEKPKKKTKPKPKTASSAQQHAYVQ